jgi:hypothetical protein
VVLAAVLTAPTRGLFLPGFSCEARGDASSVIRDEKEEGQMISDIFSMGGLFGGGGRDHDCGCFGSRRGDFHHGRRFSDRGFRHFDHHDHHRGSLLGIRISL